MLKWLMLGAGIAALSACQAVSVDDLHQEVPVEVTEAVSLSNAGQSKPNLEGGMIIAMAHEAAGGETFVKPGSLFLSGHNIIYSADGGSKTWDRYAMWRVFGDEKSDAHAANG